MEIVELKEDTRFGVLLRAERILLSGGILVAPTDTVYGILGDATSEAVIQKIFSLKNRPEEKALPIFVKDVVTARKLAYISDSKAKFLEKVWPGPVTMVFDHKEKLPLNLTGGAFSLGLRIPDNAFLRTLLGKLPFPLVQTSANISNKTPAQNLDEIKEYLAGKEIEPDLVIDGGIVKNQPSVVIDFTRDNPMILRTGVLSPAELDDLFRFMR